MVSGGFRWFQVVSGRFRSFQVVSGGFRWFLVLVTTGLNGGDSNPFRGLTSFLRSVGIEYKQKHC